MGIQGLLRGNSLNFSFNFPLTFFIFGGFRGSRGEVGILMWGLNLAPED